MLLEVRILVNFMTILHITLLQYFIEWSSVSCDVMKITLVLIILHQQEWCEKQMEFVLLHAKRRTNKAMKIGSARHAKLEEEVHF